MGARQSGGGCRRGERAVASDLARSRSAPAARKRGEHFCAQVADSSRWRRQVWRRTLPGARVVLRVEVVGEGEGGTLVA